MSSHYFQLYTATVINSKIEVILYTAGARESTCVLKLCLCTAAGRVSLQDSSQHCVLQRCNHTRCFRGACFFARSMKVTAKQSAQLGAPSPPQVTGHQVAIFFHLFQIISAHRRNSCKKIKCIYNHASNCYWNADKMSVRELTSDLQSLISRSCRSPFALQLNQTEGCGRAELFCFQRRRRGNNSYFNIKFTLVIPLLSHNVVMEAFYLSKVYGCRFIACYIPEGKHQFTNRAAKHSLAEGHNSTFSQCHAWLL